MTIVGNSPPPLLFNIFPSTGEQIVLQPAFLWVVDYERGQKYNCMLPREKFQELQTGLGT